MILDTKELFDKALLYAQQDHSGMRSGMQKTDEIFRMVRGDMVVLCGKPNEGKSTYIQYYLSVMAQRQKLKTAYLNFEGKTEETILQMVGYFDNINDFIKYVKFTEIKDLRSVEQVAYDMRQAKETEDIDVYVIDPYSNLLLGNVDTYTIAQDLALLQSTARELQIILILLCHPTKNAEAVNIYSIKGSSSFAERADIGLTIWRDFETNETVLKVDKMRAGQRGKRGEEVRYKFSKYKFIETEGDGLPFPTITPQDNTPNEHSTPSVKTIYERYMEQTAKHIDYDRIKQTQIQCYANVTAQQPYTTMPIFDAINRTNDKTIRQKIKALREETDEGKQKALKKKLECVTTSCICGRNKSEIQGYNNIICLDIDAQDNTAITTEQIHNIITQCPYIIYAVKSCRGKGYLALIQLDGTEQDFKPHFNALQVYFKARGITIDKACNNINRLRYVTIDDTPYINPNAYIYTDKADAPQKPQKQTAERTKTPTANNHTINIKEGDRAKIIEVLKQCQDNNIILNPTHNDTNILSLLIATYFGDEGWWIFQEFLKIKHPYLTEWDKYQSTYYKDVTAPKSHTIGTLLYMYRQAQTNKK